MNLEDIINRSDVPEDVKEAIRRDITERKLAEEARRESEENFRSIFENNSAALCIIEPDSTILMVNEEYCKISGYTKSEVIGMSWTQQIPPEDLERVKEYNRRRLINPTDVPDKYEFTVYKKNGEIRHALMSVTLLRNRKIIASLVDITERKQAEIELKIAKEKAEAANLAKSQFLTNMSHELRTPLNGIMGLAELMIAELSSPEHRENVRLIHKAGHSLNNIINDILDLARIEAGRAELQKNRFDLYQVLSEVSGLLMLEAKTRGIDFVLDYSKDIPTQYFGDEGRIKQVIINLAGNAVKFTHRGEVRIKATVENLKDNQVECTIEVMDTGIGILENQMESLFDKFSQGDTGTTRKYGGTGLGLAISRSIAQLLGGSIQVTSEVGVGSNFIFKVPLEAAGNTTEKNTPVNLQSLNYGARILLVEDDSMNQLVCEKLLNKMGCTCESAPNGAEAVKMFSHNPAYHLVLMDCLMPQMDGYETTQAIRKIEEGTGRHIPIIAVTACVMAEDREKCFEAGMDDYIDKPLDFSLLAQKIKRWLPL